MTESETTNQTISTETEPWENWETKLVLYSISIGVAVLIVGGIIISTFLL